ncbi:MAG: molybdate ABC transporter substrate-binding protein [Propionibacteriaceae bacterium]|jgi:molybdate transport system substrate-binding protein|nr:molybdate ABC transporter substrate-binding protein [Propionibacteriaceae bacterium]
MKHRLVAAVAVAALATLAGCTTPTTSPSTNTQTAADSQTAPVAQAPAEITVFAAASLTETFTIIAADFEAATGGHVKLVFDGSSSLVTQIKEGAPADIFASADQTNMDKAGDLVTSPVVFTSNKLTIVTPADNPAGVTSIADLPKADTVICAAAVPCGAIAAKVLAASGISLTPVSEEQSVKAVLTKVQMGEAEAGLVYSTDAKAAGDKVKEIPLPTDLPIGTAYPIALVAASAHTDQAQAFIDYVLSAAGQSVLEAAGFQA